MKRRIFIAPNAIITEQLNLVAYMHHMHSRDTHAKVERVYRVCCDPGGAICSEWLLTRFRNQDGKAYSAILLLDRDESGKDHLTEFFSCGRKLEKEMIRKWEAFVKEESNGQEN